jgi:hypothetical protein
MFSGSRLRRHPNTIEGFRSIIRRRVVGTFHRVGKKHMMPAACREFSSAMTIASTKIFPERR